MDERVQFNTAKEALDKLFPSLFRGGYENDIQYLYELLRKCEAWNVKLDFGDGIERSITDFPTRRGTLLEINNSGIAFRYDTLIKEGFKYSKVIVYRKIPEVRINDGHSFIQSVVDEMGQIFYDPPANDNRYLNIDNLDTIRYTVGSDFNLRRWDE